MLAIEGSNINRRTRRNREDALRRQNRTNPNQSEPFLLWSQHAAVRISWEVPGVCVASSCVILLAVSIFFFSTSTFEVGATIKGLVRSKPEGRVGFECVSGLTPYAYNEGNHARSHTSRQRGIGQPWLTIGAISTSLKGRGGCVISTLASHQGEPGSIPGWVTGFSQVGIVPDDAVGRRVFSGMSRFPRPCTPAPLSPRVSFHVMSGNDGHLRVPAGKSITRHDMATLGRTTLVASTSCVVLPRELALGVRGVTLLKIYLYAALVAVLVESPSTVPLLRSSRFLYTFRIKPLDNHLLNMSYITIFVYFCYIKAAVAERLARSPPTKANRVQSPAESHSDFRKWESCRTMSLVCGFSRESLVSPAFAFRCWSILISFHPHWLSRPHYQWRVVQCCKVSRCLLTAVRSRCPQQEPVTTVQPRGKSDAFPPLTSEQRGTHYTRPVLSAAELRFSASQPGHISDARAGRNTREFHFNDFTFMDCHSIRPRHLRRLHGRDFLLSVLSSREQERRRVNAGMRGREKWEIPEKTRRSTASSDTIPTRENPLLARSPSTKANWVQSAAGSPDFRKWESCLTMPWVGGFSRGSAVSPAPSFQSRSIFSSITLIGFQDLAVMSRPNIFTHSTQVKLPGVGCQCGRTTSHSSPSSAGITGGHDRAGEPFITPDRVRPQRHHLMTWRRDSALLRSTSLPFPPRFFPSPWPCDSVSPAAHAT
ncbi:hypothetical protein PR048_009275 [Dryococelus australis]|uniref:Transmembrane protein n=1 Tax=Dryococelus australis TaxID=614101 RepID=A0ABQ9HZG2_9NEOP|nr:hypothetical protein PR048_009275 [Dryococelus australis]